MSDEPFDPETVKKKERDVINWFVSLSGADKFSIQAAFCSHPDLTKELNDAQTQCDD